MFCNSELRSLEKHRGEFASRGVRVVAISVDPPEVTRDHARKMGYTHLFLADTQRDVIRRYDLVHPGGGPGGDIARPASFLLDSTGTVRWVDLTDDYRVRPRPPDILRVVDSLAPH